MRYAHDHSVWFLFALASAILAWHPLHWLAVTWTDPAYDSTGYIYALAVLLLAALSLSSGPAGTGRPHVVYGLLVSAAFLRFLSQTLAINIIGGVALAVDVLALALLLGLDRRPRALSPVWLSVLFLFSLPLQQVLERVAGFPLQLISARLSCAVLSPFFEDIACDGVRITLAGRDVLVDLPCAGASGLLLLAALWVGMNAVLRPRLGAVVISGIAMLALAVIGNAVRIAVLAVGLAAELDVMAEPVHSLIGLATLALSASPLVFLYRPSPITTRLSPRIALTLPPGFRLALAVACLGLSTWIVAQPARPLDISRPVAPRALPLSLAGETGREMSLSPLEARYFKAYGGAATKAQYGPFALNRVTTTSPLRHLHSPETCLRGLGYRTAFLGTRHDTVPTSVYRATSPDGTEWLVSVSFVSDGGHVTASVGEAVWLWLNGRGRTWSSVQRVVPLSLPEPERRRFEAATLAALDLPITTQEPQS